MRHVLTLSIGLVLLTGCGPKGGKTVVSGTITYQGQPVNGATLNLDPTGDTKGSLVLIPVTQEGTFRASDVPPGQYKITVQGSSGMSGVPDTSRMDPAKAAEMKAKIEAMQSKPTIPFPPKYTKAGTSDLTCTIVAGQQTLSLVLKD